MQKAYFDIQKLKLNAARIVIQEEKDQYENNAFLPYLENYLDLHYLLITEDLKAYQELSGQESKRLDILSKLPDNSPYKRFLQAEIRLHWAFIKLKFGNNVSGAWEIIKAFRLLEDNRKKFPNFTPTLKSLGLLHVLVGSIPDNFAWVAQILGLKGNIEGGIRELRQVQKEEPFFRQEAELIDLLLHAYTLKPSPTQLTRIRQLPEEQRDNLLLHFFATTTLMKEAKSEDALKILKEAPTGQAYIPFPFLQYLEGEILLQEGKYQQAAAGYLSFLKKYRGFNYVKDTYLKLFMCMWLDNKEQEARTYMQKVAGAGKTIIEADQLAHRLATEYLEGKLDASQKPLYQARYATDGGFLKKALTIINSVSESSFNTPEEKSEFFYRKGRILQKMEQSEQAIPLYNRTLQFTESGSRGFAASAALQLGYIYRDKSDRAKATFYFKKAMSFKKHEYKNSIDNKAKAALTELGA